MSKVEKGNCGTRFDTQEATVKEKREVNNVKYRNHVGVVGPYDNLQDKAGNGTSCFQVGCF